MIRSKIDIAPYGSFWGFRKNPSTTWCFRFGLSHYVYIYIYICNITTGNTQKNWGKGEKLSKHILLSDDHLIMARLGENDGPMKMRPVRTLTGKDWSLTEKIGS
jgi:hypothetical protein